MAGFRSLRGWCGLWVGLVLVQGQGLWAQEVQPGVKAALPFAVLTEEAAGKATFIPSGYMGNTGAIGMQDSTENPKVGQKCLKVDYRAGDNWAGVYWQNPANDWNERPGGFDLTGATRLAFWARGAKGGEKVKFLFGIDDRAKAYFDTAKGELEATLTAEWREYAIDLTGKDMRRMKSGFGWVVGGQGAPLTFFLDDVRYDGDGTAAPVASAATPAAPASAAPAASGGDLTPGAKVALPFFVLPEDAGGKDTFISSGYMGNTGAIAMNEVAEQPHDGQKCLKVEYKAGDNWGGVYWQHPAGDWNEQPGGFDLTGATKLSFWARGAKGGEKVKFLFGIDDRAKAYFDTAKGETELTLTPEWKEYTIDLAGKDLRRIKSGFGWVVGGQGAPLVFYLDGIRYHS